MAPLALEAIRTQVALLRCIMQPKSAAYLSVPITSGRRFLEWRMAAGSAYIPGTVNFENEHRRAVIEPNIAAAQSLAAAIRSRISAPLINPAAVPALPHLTQEDYYALWEQVIAEFVSEVVVSDDWSFSIGCTWEVTVAVSMKLPILSSTLSSLDTSAIAAERLNASRLLSQYALLSKAHQAASDALRNALQD